MKSEGVFVSTFLSSLGPKLGQAAGKCLKEIKTPFGQVFQVDDQGSIVTWINEMETIESRCLQEKIFGFKGPKPPFDPFPFYISWKSK